MLRILPVAIMVMWLWLLKSALGAEIYTANCEVYFDQEFGGPGGDAKGKISWDLRGSKSELTKSCNRLTALFEDTYIQGVGGESSFDYISSSLKINSPSDK
ncbi:MAG: hypothetical protein HOE90_09060 [Bacteriovoracaceae bacterium]|nr:hypothetical protein [Bacteriovoracaceae bacterium]